MPRFYFDFEIGENCYCDDQGVELESLDVARRATIRIIPTLVRDELTNGTSHDVCLKIRNETGGLIWIENIADRDFEPKQASTDQSGIYTSRGH